MSRGNGGIRGRRCVETRTSPCGTRNRRSVGRKSRRENKQNRTRDRPSFRPSRRNTKQTNNAPRTRRTACTTYKLQRRISKWNSPISQRPFIKARPIIPRGRFVAGAPAAHSPTILYFMQKGSHDVTGGRRRDSSLAPAGDDARSSTCPRLCRRSRTFCHYRGALDEGRREIQDVDTHHGVWICQLLPLAPHHAGAMLTDDAIGRPVAPNENLEKWHSFPKLRC